MAGDFLLGDVRIRPDVLTFERPDATVTVEPKVMDAVVFLAGQPGETVTRESLMAALWPDVHVSDDALNRCIWKLRRALGDDRDTPRFVATIHKRGYRLVAPVVRPGSPDPVPTAADAVPGQSRRAGIPGWAIAAAALALVVVAVGMLATRSASDAPGGLAISVSGRYEPFTSLNGYESAPAISPNGQVVVFQHYQHDGARAGQNDLMLQPVDGGDPPIYLTETAADEVFPAWSPDGAHLAFVRREGSQCELVVRTMETGASEVVSTCDPAVSSNPAWRSDGSAVLFAARDAGAGPSRIVQVGLHGGPATRLTDPPHQDDGDSQPAVSPDGRQLAFVRTRSGRVSDIYVMTLDAGPAKRLTFDARQVGGVAWSPAGDQIVFGSDRLGPFRLWTVPAEGGAPTPVPTIGHNASGPAVSGRGPALVYEEWKSVIDIREVPIDTVSAPGPVRFESRQPRPLVTSTRWDTEGRWSPDGSQFAFLSDRGGSTDVWLASADGDSPIQVTTMGTRFSSWLRWSPDGRYIAFAAPVGDQLDIHVLDPGSGILRRATFDASDERWPAWSADGRWLYFGSNRGGQWDLWRQPAEGGPAAAVTTSGGLAPSPSDDGRFVVYARADAPGLWRTSVQGPGEPERLGDVVPAGAASWDLWHDQIFLVVRPAAGPPVIGRYDLRTGVTALLAELESAAGGYPEWFSDSGVSVSPDGRRVAYASIEHSESDLWIVRR